MLSNFKKKVDITLHALKCVYLVYCSILFYQKLISHLLWFLFYFKKFHDIDGVSKYDCM